MTSSQPEPLGAGGSLQEYLRGELVALAEEPDHVEVLAGIRERVSRTGVRLTTEELLEAKDADRR